MPVQAEELMRGTPTFLIALGLSLNALSATPSDGAKLAPDVFAVVGDTVISQQDYQNAFAAGMRKKFYHGKPPQDEVARFQREVGDKLVNDTLLAAEAKRRGIAPDQTQIDKVVAGYDRQYGGSERWKAQREAMLARVVPHLERQSMLERLEQAVRDVRPSTEAEARAYYEAHKDKFTEPEQVRLSVILLKVDPSSPKSVWDAARDEADKLRARILRGADFAELARMHSGDGSADKGGDLGYVHRGMLPRALEQNLIDTLKPGEVSQPATILEGVALVRVEDRKPAQLRAYAEVRNRAAELAQRERGEAAWQQLIAELRSRTEIRVDGSRYLPLSAK